MCPLLVSHPSSNDCSRIIRVFIFWYFCSICYLLHFWNSFGIDKTNKNDAWWLECSKTNNNWRSRRRRERKSLYLFPVIQSTVILYIILNNNGVPCWIDYIAYNMYWKLALDIDMIAWHAMTEHNTHYYIHNLVTVSLVWNWYTSARLGIAMIKNHIGNRILSIQINIYKRTTTKKKIGQHNRQYMTGNIIWTRLHLCVCVFDFIKNKFNV